MWQETDKGLCKKFKFSSFTEALNFMQLLTTARPGLIPHLRWENKDKEVCFWLISHSEDGKDIITKDDRSMSVEINKQYENYRLTSTPEYHKRAFYEIKIFADGGSRGNPGPSASGYALFDMQNNIIYQEGVYIGITTNNQAEYHALKLALAASRNLHPSKIHVYMDSLLVINQMLGKFKVRNRDLWPIHQSINEMLASFKEVTFTQIPRELNKLADSLVNQALDDEIDK
jgi:ribonuclease HI